MLDMILGAGDTKMGTTLFPILSISFIRKVLHGNPNFSKLYLD